MSKGKFIVIEGGDGSGKATHVELVAKNALLNGKELEKIDFPQYGTKSAGPVEEYLNGKYGNVREVSPYTASLLFAVDRFDASFKINAALEAGKIILSNRYVLSNAAHQGAKLSDPQGRQKFWKWLEELEYGILKLPKPDITIFLHVPAEIGYELILKKAERTHLGGKVRDIHEVDLDYLKKVESVYKELATTDPSIKTIECTLQGALLPIEEINSLIMKQIYDFLH